MKGVVVKFDADRGFGFIRVAEQTDDVFVHISDVQEGRALRVGQRVAFDMGRSEKGPRAVKVVPGRVQRSPYVIFGGIAALLTIGIWIVAQAWLGFPWWAAYVLAINLSTVLLYGYDKAVAGGALLRVPERTLQGLALLFGSPGAWISQQLFHHKTHKEPFRTWFRVIVVAQVVTIIGLVWWLKATPEK